MEIAFKNTIKPVCLLKAFQVSNICHLFVSEISIDVRHMAQCSAGCDSKVESDTIEGD